MTNESPERGFQPAPLIGGLVLITIGVLFLLQEMRLADFGDIVSQYWPMIFVFIGIAKLTSGRMVGSGLAFIAVGAWLQMARLGWYGLTVRNSWPVVLIAIGAGIALQAVLDTMRREGDGPV